MNTNYQIIKLSNGEDIICSIKEQSGSEPSLKISAPLKMDVMTRPTKSGIQEGLSLTRWVQPFTDEKNIQINKSTIVTMVPASIGMSKYYEYVLKSIKGMKLVTSTTEDIEGEPTTEDLEKIELEERIEKELRNWDKQDELEKWDKQDELERLLEETSEFLKKKTRTLH